MKLQTVGGLKVRIFGGTDGRGAGDGPLVILLHGFGAAGDDLVTLADVLDVPDDTRFAFPEGPLALNLGYGDSRAWWIIDMNRLAQERAAGRLRDLSTEVPRGLPTARRTLDSFLDGLPQAMPVDPTRTILGGFSQGAMLACDLVMRTAFPIAGLIQLSGTLLARHEWASDLASRRGLPVFQSHGTQDEVLPYSMAEQLRDELTASGLSMEWQSFRGGHEIPECVVDRLGRFVTKVVTKT